MTIASGKDNATMSLAAFMFELGSGWRAARYDRLDGNFFERQFLGLKVSPAAIEHGHDHENSARHQHQHGKEKKVLLVVHLHTAIGVTNEVVHARSEKIAHRDGEEPQCHDRALHLIRGLRVGKLETGIGNNRSPKRKNKLERKLQI